MQHQRTAQIEDESRRTENPPRIGSPSPMVLVGPPINTGPSTRSKNTVTPMRHGVCWSLPRSGVFIRLRWGALVSNHLRPNPLPDLRPAILRRSRHNRRTTVPRSTPSNRKRTSWMLAYSSSLESPQTCLAIHSETWATQQAGLIPETIRTPAWDVAHSINRHPGDGFQATGPTHTMRQWMERSMRFAHHKSSHRPPRGLQCKAGIDQISNIPLGYA